MTLPTVCGGLCDRGGRWRCVTAGMVRCEQRHLALSRYDELGRVTLLYAASRTATVYVAAPRVSTVSWWFGHGMDMGRVSSRPCRAHLEQHRVVSNTAADPSSQPCLARSKHGQQRQQHPNSPSPSNSISSSGGSFVASPASSAASLLCPAAAPPPAVAEMWLRLLTLSAERAPPAERLFRRRDGQRRIGGDCGVCCQGRRCWRWRLWAQGVVANCPAFAGDLGRCVVISSSRPSGGNVNEQCNRTASTEN